MKTRLLLFSFLFSGLSFAQTIALEPFANAFMDPVEIVHAGDSRLFVVEQGGRIKILNSDGTTNGTPFLNVSSLLSIGGERGLLGLAFHPDYADNGFFYINYTNTSGNTVVARYTRDIDNPNVADPDSAMTLLTVNQPFANHNGGCLRFGPDGYLYIALGDGGSANDPQGNGQNINTLLGKLLRIDVDSGDPYSIPADNPFVGVDGMDEIWAVGLRNPWKFSFNRLNGDLWIADVGQNELEEINKDTSGEGGLNYGWRCYEGSAVFNNAGCSGAEAYEMPFAEYTHAGGACSITGGYVYTGNNYPALQGKYIFADFCSNQIGMVGDDGNIEFTSVPLAFQSNFTAFAEDSNGELYIVGQSGNVYKIIDSSLGTKDFANTSYTVYPNPATDMVYIKTGASGSNPSLVQVYDLSGKLLLSRDTDTNAIPVSTLPSGFYMMNITDNNGASASYKLAIQ